MSDEGTLVADRYRITRRLGSGAMGTVWQGKDELLGRTVAIKQLHLRGGREDSEAEEARQRAMREGRIAARLHHPNAITVFDAVADEYGQPCLIMEYLEATSLAEVLADRGTLSPVETARIGRHVAAALASAHRAGVVHRDIKPGNILLAPNGSVKITDFGISRAADDVTVTKTGLIAGTPAYLAPEVASGATPGAASDIFSLGSTLYSATEGAPPFGLTENTLGLLRAVAAGQTVPPSRSGTLTGVLTALLHPEQDNRPTADRAEELLAAVSRGEEPLAANGSGGVAGAAGAAGVAGAAGAALANADSGEAATGSVEHAGHSGTLRDVPAAGPASTRADLSATQLAAAGAPGAEEPTELDAAAGEAAEGGEEPPGGRRRWKPVAAAGGLAAAALVALGIWMLAGGEEPEPPPPSPTPEQTSPPAPEEPEPDVEEGPGEAPDPQPDPDTDTDPDPAPEQPPEQDTEPEPSPEPPPEQDNGEPGPPPETGPEPPEDGNGDGGNGNGGNGDGNEGSSGDGGSGDNPGGDNPGGDGGSDGGSGSRDGDNPGGDGSSDGNSGS